MIVFFDESAKRQDAALFSDRDVICAGLSPATRDNPFMWRSDLQAVVKPESKSRSLLLPALPDPGLSL